MTVVCRNASDSFKSLQCHNAHHNYSPKHELPTLFCKKYSNYPRVKSAGSFFGFRLIFFVHPLQMIAEFAEHTRPLHRRPVCGRLCLALDTPMNTTPSRGTADSEHSCTTVSVLHNLSISFQAFRRWPYRGQCQSHQKVGRVYTVSVPHRGHTHERACGSPGVCL